MTREDHFPEKVIYLNKIPDNFYLISKSYVLRSQEEIK